MSGFSSFDPSLQYKQAYIQDEFFITCSSCGRKLLNIIITEHNDTEMDVVATCPCGDRSFLKTVKGKFRYASPEDLSIINVEMITDINCHELTLFSTQER